VRSGVIPQENFMNRFRSLALATLLLAAFAACAQQNSAPSAEKPPQASSTSPVDQHLSMLTQRLDLTADQQAKLRPIVQQMMDRRQKLLDDKTLTDEERHQKMKTLHQQALRHARTYLTDEQNKKLDALEQEHHQSHGN
jgi:Spy/CpxP family protein refolding chaperone